MQIYSETYEDGQLVDKTPLTDEEQKKHLLISQLNDQHQLWLEAINTWETNPTPQKWAIVRDMLRWILLHDDLI